MIDPAKARMMALLLAALLGLAGAFALASAVTSALKSVMPEPLALAVTAVLLIGAAVASAWLAFRPTKSIDKEGEQLAAAASHALADLPIDMARKMIVERPVAALAMSSALGALIARRPSVATDLLEKLLNRLV